MTDEEIDDLKIRLYDAEAEARRWRERCAVHEAHRVRLEQSAAAIAGRVEQFLIVLRAGQPQGIAERDTAAVPQRLTGEPA